MVIVFLSPEMRVAGWFPFIVKDVGISCSKFVAFISGSWPKTRPSSVVI